METQKSPGDGVVTGSGTINGRLVHVFGSGHSRIMVEEMWPRYGSFPGWNPVVELSLTFHNPVVGANGQVLGGVVMGIGTALSEGMMLDETQINAIVDRVVRKLSPEQYNVLRILRGTGGEGLPCLEIAAQMVTRMPAYSLPCTVASTGQDVACRRHDLALKGPWQGPDLERLGQRRNQALQYEKEAIVGAQPEPPRRPHNIYIGRSFCFL